jgi:hypothetical protein
MKWVEQQINMKKNGRSGVGCANHLNRLGIPSALGKQWQSSSLLRTLRSKTQKALGHTIEARYVNHPKLGRQRVEWAPDTVAAD